VICLQLPQAVAKILECDGAALASAAREKFGADASVGKKITSAGLHARARSCACVRACVRARVFV
jgi:hypothetical protein